MFTHLPDSALYSPPLYVIPLPVSITLIPSIHIFLGRRLCDFPGSIHCKHWFGVILILI